MSQNYQDPLIPGFIMRSARAEDNEQLTALIAETMPSNGMIMSFQRQPSYITATHAQYEYPDIQVVVPESQPELIVGMMNLGHRECYINGVIERLRYVGDLRLHREYRGKYVLELMMSYLYQHIPAHDFLQAVILDDNRVARHLLHQERAGFPQPYIYDDIRTFTVTKVKYKSYFSNYSVIQLNPQHLDEANLFIEKMAKHYNFLPSYNFFDLQAGHPYWNGMQMHDFYLVYNAEMCLVGLYGLWDQKSFKQTKVKSYASWLNYFKPFYNLYAQITRNIMLPKAGEAFDYLMLHSMLCAPHDSEVFHSMLHHACLQTKQRGKQAYCLTLACKDQRIDMMSVTRHHKISAKHSFHSFGSNPFDIFAPEKISYFEVGRI